MVSMARVLIIYSISLRFNLFETMDNPIYIIGFYRRIHILVYGSFLIQIY